jgi:cytochrome c-type biogenesis protein CcmH/NrfG
MIRNLSTGRLFCREFDSIAKLAPALVTEAAGCERAAHLISSGALTLMTALLFPTLIALGFWQLERADEKARIAVQQAERAAQARAPWHHSRDYPTLSWPTVKR